MHLIKSESRRRVATCSKSYLVVAKMRWVIDPSRAPRYWSPRAGHPAPYHSSRPRHTLGYHGMRRRHHSVRRNCCRMENRRHCSAPLRLHTYREKNYKTSEDNLADHGSHLEARSPEPGSNNLAHLQGCANSAIGFNPIPLVYRILCRHVLNPHPLHPGRISHLLLIPRDSLSPLPPTVL